MRSRLLIITKRDHVTPACARAGVTVIEAGHPVPDEQSLCAGEELLNFIALRHLGCRCYFCCQVVPPV